MKKSTNFLKNKFEIIRNLVNDKGKRIGDLFKSNWKLIMLVLTAIIFFSSILILCFDSAHYLIYVEIFEGKRPFSNWDIVRGPVFPYIIYLATRLFGRTAMGILIMFYLFYLVFAYCTSKILDRLIIDGKYKFWMKMLLLLYLIFNPIVLGYYHTLLTENVGMTIMMTSCYMAWQWQFAKNKKSKFLFSIYFSVMASFAYFLKQPYVYTVVIPMIIGIIYALLANHTFKNVRYYCGTFLILVAILWCSIIGWNNFLVYKGVTMQHDRMSDGMLSRQLLTGSSHIKLSRVEKYSEVRNDKFLSKSEKDIISDRIENGLGTVIVTLTDLKNHIVSKDIIKADNFNDVSVSNSIASLTKMYFSHPLVITSAYAKNYCAMSSLCVVATTDGSNLYITDKLNFEGMYENSAIAYKTFTEWGSFYYLSEDGEVRASDFYQISHPGYFTQNIFNNVKYTNILFKFAILILPFIVVTMFVFWAIKRKIFSEVEINIFKLSMLLLCSSLICLIANAFIGLIIDRYSAFAFPIILLGLVGCISVICSVVVRQLKKI